MRSRFLALVPALLLPLAAAIVSAQTQEGGRGTGGENDTPLLETADDFISGGETLPFATPKKEEKTEPLKALVEINKDEIFENSPFEITIIVNHSSPEEVTVNAPDFKDEFTLDKLRTQARIMNLWRSGGADDKEQDRWTEINLLLVPLKAGFCTMGSFSISSPKSMVWTAPMEFNVKPEKTVLTPSLSWTAPRAISTGETYEIRLRVSDWDKTQAYPRDMPVNIAAPKNAVLQKLKLSGDDKFYGVVLRLSITAIDSDSKEVRLEQVTFTYNKWTLTVPELILPVQNAKNAAGRRGGAASLINGAKNEGKEAVKLFLEKNAEAQMPVESALAFPDAAPFGEGFLIGLNRKEWEENVSEARRLWADNLYAASLALLRKRERDSIAGASYSALRKKAEEVLGIKNLLNEPYRPKVLFFAALICGGALFILFALLRLLRKGRQTAGIVLSLVIAGGALYFIIRDKIEENKSAVLYKSSYYAVPEDIEEMQGVFEEGSPVQIGSYNGEWLYVEGLDAAGWIHKSNAVVY